jgi:heme-degrading monooxygenase HmoA
MFAAAAPSSAEAAAGKPPIQLNCDLAVDPKKEKEFIQYFDSVFRPVARKHQGYIDLKLLKLNQAVRGLAPAGGTFRFALTYQVTPTPSPVLARALLTHHESEALRQKWIASDDHAKAWAPMEDMLTDKNFGILVYDAYEAT